jgi:poly(3-hydroxybutyrate) depolymerase
LKYWLLILLFPLLTHAQPCRYQLRIFSAFDKTANVIYGAAPAINAPYLFENSTSSQNLLLDIFQPVGDTAQKRALIIFAHSGGFINGTKDNEDMQALCDSFSLRGYVTATLNYRLGFNVLSSNASERAVWRGIQDGSAAVRFFKQNAALYKIDTTSIFLWGSSAGSFLALGLAYLDDAERPASTFSGFLRPDLGCKDCAGNSFTHSSKVTGIISCWGATKDTAWIQNNNNIPVQLFHGIADATVPYTEGYPFGLPTITYVRGSQQINEQLNRTSIYHEFYNVPALGHEYWGTSNGTFIPAGPTAYWQDIITKSKDFMLGRMAGLPACALPVRLSSFTGNLADEKIKLSWETSLELNLKNMIIERSIDGTRYDELASILPKGLHGAGAIYTAFDNHPFSGLNYYRLKLVDMDGSYTYSDIVTIKTKMKALEITQLYPNPVINRLTVQLQSAKDLQVNYTIFDMTGKQIILNTASLKTGLTHLEIPFENIATGMYLIKIENRQHGYSTSSKIVKF